MIKNRLQEIIHEKELTFKEVADMCHLQVSTVSKLAKGHSTGIRFDTWEALAEGLNVPFDSLFYQEE